MVCDICGKKRRSVHTSGDGINRCDSCENRRIYGVPNPSKKMRSTDAALERELQVMQEDLDFAALEIGASR